jgi:hypothetical protein
MLLAERKKKESSTQMLLEKSHEIIN